MTDTFLLEIGTEEIPARFIPGALQALKELARERLQQQRLSFGELKTMGTPRRLTLFVSNLASFQTDQEETIIGPPQNRAFSEDGQPTQVAYGFAKAKKRALEELELIDTPKGIYLGLRHKTKGLAAATVLAELLPQLILDLPFPKSMRWGEGIIRFARPIHWLVALWGDQVIPFRIGEIESGNQTRGHRFMAGGPISLRDAADYLPKLQEAFVIADPETRRALLLKGLESLSKKAGGELLPDPELVLEVTHLVEYPAPVVGRFDEAFLALPAQVLITSMKEHQRYFPLFKTDGSLMPRFIAVNNTEVKNSDQVIRGHEKVLRARLSDARFFFLEDLKEPLEKKISRLKGVVFHSRLGTSYEKVERIVALAAFLARKLAPEKTEGVARTAWLCKADLTTHMVGEFPTLQGIMGREYALRAGEPEEVAQGIEDHYRPYSHDGALPQSTTGALVGMADRLDSLLGFFSLGQIPTGSADPYALRRMAQGLILVIWDKGYSLSLSQVFDRGLESFTNVAGEAPEQIKRNLFEFFNLRLGHLLEAEGIGRETIEAVLAGGWDDLGEVKARAQALDQFQQHPDFSSLTRGCKRALNILKGFSASEPGLVDKALLIEPQELELLALIREKEERLNQLFREQKFLAYLQELAQLRTPIDAFFDKVLVMAPDNQVKNNRLALLFYLTSLFNRFAVFSKFSISG